MDFIFHSERTGAYSRNCAGSRNRAWKNGEWDAVRSGRIVSYRNDDCIFLTAVCDKKGIDTKTIGIMIFRVIVNCLRTIHRRDEQFYKQRKPANLPANGFRCFIVI